MALKLPVYKEIRSSKETTKKIQNCFGDYKKTSIFAPAIEK